jgi:phosphoribosyl 1,2-cyclic phosphodiesterase
MKKLGLDMEQVKAIFISHEHADHVCGISVTSKKYQVPVYITQPTLRNGRLFIPKNQIHTFKAYEPINVGSLSITAFSKMHDAADPYSFIITGSSTTVGVFTDIGLPCSNVVRYFQQCQAVFLESNYDEDMLMKGSYPYHLKNRIHGDKGHLSNSQALQLFKKYKSPTLSHLFLSHLSKNNNCPKLVYNLFSKHAGDVQVIVTSRYEESALYRIETQTNTKAPTVITTPSHPQLAMEF